MKKVIVIETHHENSVEWGISFDGPNPTCDYYFKMPDKDTAFKLEKLINQTL